MANARIGAIGESLQRLFGEGTVAGLSERQLLDRFLTRDDPAAFEAIVARHGPMVLGVCRRWLDDPNDADDAFQATFLVLVRKARGIRQRELLANWLYGVALRVAKRARRQAIERRRREAALAAETNRMDGAHDHVVELHEELARLPRDYRLPLVLCYLEGRTHEEAALELGWPLGTVKGRLARARDLLRRKLTRRGLAPTSGLVVSALQQTPAAVKPALLEATVRAATAATAGKLAAAAVSGTITLLTRETLQAMWMSKITAIGSTGALIAAFATGGAALAYRQGTEKGAETAQAPNTATQQPAPKPSQAATVAEPPEVAEAMMYRHKRFEEQWPGIQQRFLEGTEKLEQAYEVSRLLLNSELHLARSEEDRQKAMRSHYDRIDQLLAAYVRATRRNEAARPETTASNAAPRDVAQTANPPTATSQPAAGAVSGGFGGGSAAHWDDEEARLKNARLSFYRGLDRDPRTLAILAKLERPYKFPFQDDTPLQEVIIYVKDVTRDDSEMPEGIPIYLDEVGLQQAGTNVTPASTVKLQLEGVSLRTALRLMLRQLGLAYVVKEGVLIISSPEALVDEVEDALLSTETKRAK